MRQKADPPKSTDPRCNGKRMFGTRDQAVSHLNRARRGPSIDYKPLFQTYTCPHCGHFHLGHDWKKISQGATAQ